MGIHPDMGGMCSKSSNKVHNNANGKANDKEGDCPAAAEGAKELSLDAIVTLEQVSVGDRFSWLPWSRRQASCFHFSRSSSAGQGRDLEVAAGEQAADGEECGP